METNKQESNGSYHQVKAVIFDLDGTLWDACQTTANGWSAALKKFGQRQTITHEQIAQVTGIPFEQAVDITLPGMCKTHPTLPTTIPAA